jgi:hypothetical protein
MVYNVISPDGSGQSEDAVSWIERQMTRREWRRADLTRGLHVPSGNVSRSMNSRQSIDVTYVKRIADVFHADEALLLSLAGQSNAR